AQELRGIVGLERGATGEQLEEDQADGVEIGARVDLAARGLLRRHVARGPKHDALPRELLAAALVEQLGDAKVDDLDDLVAAEILAQEDVLGLEIAVDDADVVGVLEAEKDLLDRGDGLVGGPRAAGLAVEVATLEQLHDQVLGPAVARSEVRDRQAGGRAEAGVAGGLP